MKIWGYVRILFRIQGLMSIKVFESNSTMIRV